MASEAETEILALERALLEPETRHNAEWLDGVLAEDFLEFGKSGSVHDKAATIAALAGGPAELADRFALTMPNFVLLSPDAALLIYRLEPLVQDGDAVPSLRSSLWRKAGGTWRLAFHQGTAAAGP